MIDEWYSQFFSVSKITVFNDNIKQSSTKAYHHLWSNHGQQVQSGSTFVQLVLPKQMLRDKRTLILQLSLLYICLCLISTCLIYSRQPALDHGALQYVSVGRIELAFLRFARPLTFALGAPAAQKYCQIEPFVHNMTINNDMPL